MGFDEFPSKKGSIWVGVSSISGQLERLSIHSHAEGRDIPDGLFQTYWKQLGFKNKGEFDKWKNENL